MLTPKQKKFARLLSKSPTQAEAYELAFPNSSHDSAKSSACRLLSDKPEILEIARKIADRNNYTLDRATKTLAKKLNAKKTLTTTKGELIQVDDNTAQIKSAEICLKVHGALKDNDNSITYNNLEVNQNLIIDKLGSRLDNILRLFDDTETADSTNEVRNKKSQVIEISNVG